MFLGEIPDGCQYDCGFFRRDQAVIKVDGFPEIAGRPQTQGEIIGLVTFKVAGQPAVIGKSKFHFIAITKNVLRTDGHLNFNRSESAETPVKLYNLSVQVLELLVVG